ncbi:hypothetical protein KKI24_02865 [bacterium]|nr:hypothetical protein [bacterium]
MKVRRKALLEATQWNKLGDHPEVIQYIQDDQEETCIECGKPSADHGQLIFFEFKVCPGSWIIEAEEKQAMVFSQDAFDRMFEVVE